MSGGKRSPNGANASTTSTLEAAKLDYEAIVAEAEASPERVCEYPGCPVSIADRDPTARFCLRHVGLRLGEITGHQRIARHRSAHAGAGA
ncbi:MAG: hypothetical protein OXU81_21870 [Gammaproteobacteria bacterium]|nr:hypothetical protein [Gammaproteobacteria bacterium]